MIINSKYKSCSLFQTFVKYYIANWFWVGSGSGYHGCQSVLIYFHNIPLLGEIVFHVALWHFHIITFHQVLELSSSFGLHYLLRSKANLFQLSGQSRMQEFQIDVLTSSKPLENILELEYKLTRYLNIYFKIQWVLTQHYFAIAPFSNHPKCFT